MTVPIPQQRDAEQSKKSLATWFATTLQADGDVQLSDFRGPGATGFSNETLIVDAVYRAQGEDRSETFVIRVAPTGYTLFPNASFDLQHHVLRALRDHDVVPVPNVRWVEQGLAGRTGFTVVGQGIVGVARDEQELAAAEQGVRTLIAFYASTPAYRVVLDVHGWGDLQVELRDLTRAGRWDELPGAVPQEVVDEIAVVGTPAEVAVRLRTRYAGCARVGLSLPYAVSTETLGELVDSLAD